MKGALVVLILIVLYIFLMWFFAMINLEALKTLMFMIAGWQIGNWICRIADWFTQK